MNAINPAPQPERFQILRIVAESYWDAQKARIAVSNRLSRSRHLGMFDDLTNPLRQTEDKLGKILVANYRTLVRAELPAVEAWQRQTYGVGEHMLGRLLGHLGHPRIAHPHRWMTEPPDGHACDPLVCKDGKRHLVALEPFERSLRQLWAYAGHGDASPIPKGASQDELLARGNVPVKTLVHLIAEGTMKVPPLRLVEDSPPVGAASADRAAAGSVDGPPPLQVTATERGPVGDVHDPFHGGDRYYFRRLYDTRKLETAERVDANGKPWTPAHAHADALRIVGKEILRDLWTLSEVKP